MDFIKSSNALLKQLKILGDVIINSDKENIDLLPTSIIRAKVRNNLVHAPKYSNKKQELLHIQAVKAIELENARRRKEQKRKLEKILLSEYTFHDVDSYNEIISNNSIYGIIREFDINEFLHHTITYSENSDKLAENLIAIKLLNRIEAALKQRLGKYCPNKREFFRKINSFLFKNLDDYHSAALVLKAY